MTEPLDETAIEPILVAEWLQKHGYKYVGSSGEPEDADAIYERVIPSRYGNPTTVLFFLPSSPTVPDFKRRMAKLVDDFAHFERYSRAEALADLLRISQVFRDTRLPRGIDEPG